MKKKIWIIIGFVILLSLFIFLNLWEQKDKSSKAVDVTTLSEKTIDETVIAPGKLIFANQEAIYLDESMGNIAEVFIEEGDTVKEGEELFRYESRQLLLEKEQIELQLESNALQLNSLRKKHRDIDKQLEKDKDSKPLQEEHDQIKLEEQMAANEYRQTQIQKEQIEEQMKDLVVKSTVAGKVVSLDKQIISGVNQVQNPFIYVGSFEELIVEGIISEYDTLKVKEGQQAIITSDAVPEKSWKGEVSTVSYLPVDIERFQTVDGEIKGEQYSIEVSIKDDAIDLRPGLQMLIEIEISNSSAQVLPLSAVKQDDETDYVFVINHAGEAEKREVQVGIAAGDYIEVIDGVTSSEDVIIDPHDIKDGMEVTVQ